MTEYMTRAGHEKLIKDLEELKKRKPGLSQEIAEAREKGDLRENAEYHTAKDRLAELMNRIQIIETKLASAQLIDNIQIKAGMVQIGVKVTLKDSDGDEYVWTLVGAEEADPAKGMLSVFSPLAQGILGKKVKEEVIVDLPAGPQKFKIIKTEPGL